MNWIKYLGKVLRGWLPEEGNTPNVKSRVSRAGSGGRFRLVAIIGGSAALIVVLFFLSVYVMLILNPIYPADVCICDTLNDKRDSLLGIEDVFGAGIARNSTNYIYGNRPLREGRLDQPRRDT